MAGCAEVATGCAPFTGFEGAAGAGADALCCMQPVYKISSDGEFNCMVGKEDPRVRKDNNCRFLVLTE
jgi:hypothetical protein